MQCIQVKRKVRENQICPWYNKSSLSFLSGMSSKIFQIYSQKNRTGKASQKVMVILSGRTKWNQGSTLSIFILKHTQPTTSSQITESVLMPKLDGLIN